MNRDSNLVKQALLEPQMGGPKTLHSQTAAELDALLPCVLDKAFKGDLLRGVH